MAVLAPLVFGEALGSSYLDLRKVSRPVLALAVGLVIASTMQLAPDEASAFAQSIGYPTLMDGALAAVADQTGWFVTAGFSMGAILAEYVAAASARGFREVRLIHGRGIGAQRAIVRKALERSPHVVSFADATPDLPG